MSVNHKRVIFLGFWVSDGDKRLKKQGFAEKKGKTGVNSRRIRRDYCSWKERLGYHWE